MVRFGWLFGELGGYAFRGFFLYLLFGDLEVGGRILESIEWDLNS